jgi:hypothetical protein
MRLRWRHVAARCGRSPPARVRSPARQRVPGHEPAALRVRWEASGRTLHELGGGAERQGSRRPAPMPFLLPHEHGCWRRAISGAERNPAQCPSPSQEFARIGRLNRAARRVLRSGADGPQREQTSALLHAGKAAERTGGLSRSRERGGRVRARKVTHPPFPRGPVDVPCAHRPRTSHARRRAEAWSTSCAHRREKPRPHRRPTRGVRPFGCLLGAATA